jgi:urocanate hydratase
VADDGWPRGRAGIGHSLHASQVTVADGTEMMAKRIERVLTDGPGDGRIRASARSTSLRASFQPCR